MNDPTLGGMIPFDTIGLYEQPKPRFIFKMPKVVPDQKTKFESDDVFKKLSRDGEIRYTGFRDRPAEERQIRFQNGCREGHTELSFVSNGVNIQLIYNPHSGLYLHDRECDFDKELGKVHLKSSFIMNGVCVRFRGWVDLERLDGIGSLELDEKRAAQEDLILRDQLERYNSRLRDYEDKQRSYHQHHHLRSASEDYDQMRRHNSTAGGGGVVGISNSNAPVTAGSVSVAWRR